MNICFTGRLELGSRDEAWDLARNAGHIPQRRINHLTDVLVAGVQTAWQTKGGSSEKERTAEWCKLKVITEREFLALCAA